MKKFKLALVILMVLGIQSQAIAYYSYDRSANQEMNQVTDLDGNPISGFDVNYSGNSTYYDNYNYSNNNNYSNNSQCYDTYNHVYYNCSNSTNNNYNNNYNYNYTYSTTTGNQCFDSVNRVYYNCNKNTSTSSQCYDSYNHVYYNCSNSTSYSTTSSSSQCYDSYNHVYYNCSNSSTSTLKLVYIQNNAVSPTTTTIRKGSYVKWVNRDNTGHRIIGDYSEFKIDSGTLYQNYTYSKAFSTVGTYRYHDSSNSGIYGTIIVTN